MVVADLRHIPSITPAHLEGIGYHYDEATDKWNISDAAADYLYTGNQILPFALPGTLQVIVDHTTWQKAVDKSKYHPYFADVNSVSTTSDILNFVHVEAGQLENGVPEALAALKGNVIPVISSENAHAMASVRRLLIGMMERKLTQAVILQCNSNEDNADQDLIHFATETGALLLDGFGDGLWLTAAGNTSSPLPLIT